MKSRARKKVCMKVGYYTKSDARTALREQKNIGVKRFYKCPYHNVEMWHLTSEDR